MLTSDAYGSLAKALGALRAHDTDTVEALADPRPRSRRKGSELAGGEGELGDEDEGQEQEVEGSGRVSAAAGVLRFSTERDPPASREASTAVTLRTGRACPAA